MGLIVETLCTLGSLLVLMWSMAAHPQHARCPQGAWYVNGIRPSGAYECRRDSIGPNDEAPTPPGVIYGRLYCTGGSHPIVDINSGKAVGCQR